MFDDIRFMRTITHFIAHTPKVIARLVDGSEFDEFKRLYGETLVTG